MSDQKNEYYTGQLGEYKRIKTEDGSYTLRSQHFNEAFHSLNGAYAETLHNYILPNKVLELWSDSTREQLNILEVGLGVGVGIVATFEALAKAKSSGPSLSYLALELDEALVAYTIKNASPQNSEFPQLSELKKFECEQTVYYQAQKGLHTLTILIGDARKSLPRYLDLKKRGRHIHVIYQDPFSPRKNPTLWTYEWFGLLASCCHKGATLSTYCASVSPRKAMLKAGFRPQRLKGMGFKREITLAQFHADTALDEELEKSLIKSKAPTLIDADTWDYRSL